MKLRLLCAAFAAITICAPAHAALWILNINAPITGTLSVYCTQNFPNCDAGVKPFSGVVKATIAVEEFDSSTTFNDTISGRFGGRYGSFSGTLVLEGYNLFGRDFLYYEDNFIASPSKYWFASADSFSVSVDPYSRAGPVPEPTTWAMMLLGFTVVGAKLRRRQIATALLARTVKV